MIQPAIALADQGIAIDWYLTLKAATMAKELSRYPSTKDVWLPGGLPPVTAAGAPLGRLQLKGLASTLKRLAEAGPRDFYEGELADQLVADLRAGGSPLSAEDFRRCRAQIGDPVALDYRGVRVHGATPLSGAPTLVEALRAIDRSLPAAPRAMPDAETFVARFTSDRSHMRRPDGSF